MRRESEPFALTGVRTGMSAGDVASTGFVLQVVIYSLSVTPAFVG
jgi:hypothetical protein